MLDPAHVLSTAHLLVVFGGPVLYLAGHALFRWVMIHSVSGKRLTAMAALAALGVVAGVAGFRADVSAATATAVLVALAIWEYRPQERREQRYREVTDALR
jgi:low temperature requirement protein LtrA